MNSPSNNDTRNPTSINSTSRIFNLPSVIIKLILDNLLLKDKIKILLLVNSNSIMINNINNNNKYLVSINQLIHIEHQIYSIKNKFKLSYYRDEYDWSSSYDILNCISSPNLNYILFTYKYSYCSRNGDGSDTAYYSIYYNPNSASANSNNNDWIKLLISPLTYRPNRSSLCYHPINSDNDNIYYGDSDGYREGFKLLEWIINKPATIKGIDIKSGETREFDCISLIVKNIESRP